MRNSGEACETSRRGLGKRLEEVLEKTGGRLGGMGQGWEKLGECRKKAGGRLPADREDSKQKLRGGGRPGRRLGEGFEKPGRQSGESWENVDRKLEASREKTGNRHREGWKKAGRECW